MRARAASPSVSASPQLPCGSHRFGLDTKSKTKVNISVKQNFSIFCVQNVAGEPGSPGRACATRALRCKSASGSALGFRADRVFMSRSGVHPRAARLGPPPLWITTVLNRRLEPHLSQRDEAALAQSYPAPPPWSGDIRARCLVRRCLGAKPPQRSALPA
jgi:hypothetical protein